VGRDLILSVGKERTLVQLRLQGAMEVGFGGVLNAYGGPSIDSKGGRGTTVATFPDDVMETDYTRIRAWPEKNGKVVFGGAG